MNVYFYVNGIMEQILQYLANNEVNIAMIVESC